MGRYMGSHLFSLDRKLPSDDWEACSVYGALVFRKHGIWRSNHQPYQKGYKVVEEKEIIGLLENISPPTKILKKKEEDGKEESKIKNKQQLI